nr:PREDICTED: chaoptin [Tribolium castaneum]|eukprot:XP_008194619.1 PREDICTED: chaoptin [Tribolium castaneum]
MVITTINSTVVEIEEDTTLVNVDLQENTKLCNKMFNLSSKVESLIITGPHVVEIETNFLHSQNVYELSISNTGITTIKKYTFKNLKIQTLELFDNEIQTLEAKAFADLFQLHKLDLSNNDLTTLDLESFYRLPLLDYFDAKGNQIVKLGKQFFQILRKDYSEMWLCSNKIQVLGVEFFEGLGVNNISIDLNRNLIEFISPHVFQGHSFREIDLSFNPVTISEDFFRSELEIKTFVFNLDYLHHGTVEKLVTWAEINNITLVDSSNAPCVTNKMKTFLLIPALIMFI